jgi:hypothetical protein
LTINTPINGRILDKIRSEKWPDYISSDVVISDKSGDISLENNPIPMGFLMFISSLTYLVINIIVFVFDRQYFYLSLICMMAPIIGGYYIVKSMDEAREMQGPMARIFGGKLYVKEAVVPLDDISGVFDVYFKKRGYADGYRCVVVMAHQELHVIAWQCANVWLSDKPKIADISEVLKCRTVGIVAMTEII